MKHSLFFSLSLYLLVSSLLPFFALVWCWWVMLFGCRMPFNPVYTSISYIYHIPAYIPLSSLAPLCVVCRIATFENESERCLGRLLAPPPSHYCNWWSASHSTSIDTQWKLHHVSPSPPGLHCAPTMPNSSQELWLLPQHDYPSPHSPLPHITITISVILSNAYSNSNNHGPSHKARASFPCLMNPLPSAIAALLRPHHTSLLANRFPQIPSFVSFRSRRHGSWNAWASSIAY